MNPSGKGKLSKRTQAFDDNGQEVLVKVEEFQAAGLLPEAVVNFLANVGYSTGNDQEMYTVQEAIENFKLENINPAPSRLPYDKLDWLNGQYIQKMEPADLAQAIVPFVKAAGYDATPESLEILMPAMRTRLRRLTEAVDFLRFLFEDEPLNATADMLTHKKLPQPAALAAFSEARDFIAQVSPFSLDEISKGLMAIGEKHTENQKAGPFLGQMRFAVTGQKVSPPLFESIVALGREKTLKRLDMAVAILSE
jgi:glutamyl-tRNA synthetase